MRAALTRELRRGRRPHAAAAAAALAVHIARRHQALRALAAQLQLQHDSAH